MPSKESRTHVLKFLARTLHILKKYLLLEMVDLFLVLFLTLFYTPPHISGGVVCFHFIYSHIVILFKKEL